MGVFDKVAIVGMGCCKFGELWDKSREDMIIDAAYEAYEDAGIGVNDIQAAWVGNVNDSGPAMRVADALKFGSIPISRCENICVSPIDAFRNACFAVSAGMYDRVMVVGYEKLKESPLGVAPTGISTGLNPLLGGGGGSAAPLFAVMATRYMERYGIDRTPLAKVSVKNHHNGSLTPKAHLHNEVTLEQVLNAPLVCWPFGLFDCCGISDGAAVAIITRKEIAKSFRDDYITVRGIGLSVSSVVPQVRPGYEYLRFNDTEMAALQAYEQAGIKDPRKEIDCAEVHDCFSMTEIKNYEDLHFCGLGEGWRFIEDGIPLLDGELPVNMDGGLKCFGHPIGASGLRMMYEIYKQLQGKCGERQVKGTEVGLAHVIGGMPQASAVIVMSN